MTAVAELPSGAAGVELLEATVPCPIPWCTGCTWEFDEVGGAISRSHTLKTDQGLLLAVMDYPPGDPRNDDIEATEPLISMPQTPADAYSVDAAAAIQASLGAILELVRST